jgi:hypothetical protein
MTEYITNCERCGEKPKGYGLHDYCAKCARNLCDKCMAEGCCGSKPAESGATADDVDDYVPRQQKGS